MHGDAGGAARDPHRWQPDYTTTTDQVLIHLTAAVPTTEAIPEELARSKPSHGYWMSIFGYGCTDRTPQSGGGFKQVFDFQFGHRTTALCWGDSGGPVFLGSANGSRRCGASTATSAAAPTSTTCRTCSPRFRRTACRSRI